MRRKLVLAVLLAATLAAWPRPSLADRPHESEMREIARVLACPVCQGLSVSDSPSPLATQMRDTILQKLEAGESRQQIVQYFVDRYGEGILFDPPKQGFSLLVWWVPTLTVLAGGVIVGLILARRPGRAPAEPEQVTADELARYRPRLEAELARLDERAP